MILNNYWELLKTQQTTTFSSSGTSVVYTNMREDDGSAISFAYQGSADVAKNWNMRENMNVVVGSSDETGRASDYDLRSRLSSGVSVGTPSITYAVGDGKIQKVVTFTVTASASITIKEVGIRKGILLNYSGTISNILLARAVLDNPISLSSGQSAVIAVEWIEA